MENEKVITSCNYLGRLRLEQLPHTDVWPGASQVAWAKLKANICVTQLEAFSHSHSHY